VVKLTYIASCGTSRAVDAEEGASVMEAAIRNMIPEIDGECGGACACATCHIYLHEDWMPAAGTPDQAELDMLAFAHEVRPTHDWPARSKYRRGWMAWWHIRQVLRIDAGFENVHRGLHSA
jgi:ferredoxin, 2Fe-2S